MSSDSADRVRETSGNRKTLEQRVAAMIESDLSDHRIVASTVLRRGLAERIVRVVLTESASAKETKR